VPNGFGGGGRKYAAKRGLPPIPAFGIGWLYPVCPRRANLALPRTFFIPPDEVLPHNATDTKFPAQFAGNWHSCPRVFENADRCARRKAGTATNSRLWNWLAVPGLPHGTRNARPCPPKPLSTRAGAGSGYFRKTNHSLAAKFSSEHSAMARPPAT
jgi:hypothetical protein